MVQGGTHAKGGLWRLHAYCLDDICFGLNIDRKYRSMRGWEPWYHASYNDTARQFSSPEVERNPMSARKPVPAKDAAQVKGYAEFLGMLKQRIQSAQFRAAMAVNEELLALYWDLGREIVERQEREGWGSSVIDRLSSDLRRSFPEIKGFSSRNVSRMRAFYLAYASLAGDASNLPQAVAKIPWGHHSLILEKLKDQVARRWYGEQALVRFPIELGT